MLDYTFMQNAFLVSVCIAILCPCIGIFLVLRRYSMIGDTLAHASLAGIAFGLLFNENPLLGAFLFTSVSGAVIEFLRTYFKKHTDLILSVILALGVGTAITIISSGKLHANADAYLFGSILTVTRTDILTVAALTVLSIFIVTLFYHQLIYIAYDEDAARVAGVRVRLMNYVFAVLVAAAVSVSIRITGTLVIGSMIALPVAAALQLEKGFRQTLLWSLFFSFIDIMSGLVFSYYLNVAPGGLTALMSVAVLLAAIGSREAQAKWRKIKRETP